MPTNKKKMKFTTMVMTDAKTMHAETKYGGAGDDDGGDDCPMDEPAAGDDRREGFLAPLDATANIMIDQNSYY